MGIKDDGRLLSILCGLYILWVFLRRHGCICVFASLTSVPLSFCIKGDLKQGHGKKGAKGQKMKDGRQEMS